MKPDEPEFGAGEVLAGKFRIIRQLGAGGIGSVYEIEHSLTRHRRALKVLHPRFRGNKELLKRFLREATAAARIGSENVVETLDVGITEDGTPWQLMELLLGHSLGEILRWTPRLPIGDACGLGLKLAEVVGQAHEKGIVHRDLKPDNIFIGERDERPFVKVLDFGLSKFSKDLGLSSLTTPGAAIGTPLYMAPEQMTGGNSDSPALDVFAIGMIVYECLVGGPPFSARDYSTLVLQKQGEHFPPIEGMRKDCPDAIAEVVRRALSVEPGSRPSARSFARALAPWSRPDAAGERWWAPDEQSATTQPQGKDASASGLREASDATATPVLARPAAIRPEQETRRGQTSEQPKLKRASGFIDNAVFGAIRNMGWPPFGILVIAVLAMALLFVFTFKDNLLDGLKKNELSEGGVPVRLSVKTNPPVVVTVVPQGLKNRSPLELGRTPLDEQTGAFVGDTVLLVNEDRGIRFEEVIEYGQPNELKLISIVFKESAVRITTTPSLRNCIVWRANYKLGQCGVRLSLFAGIHELEIRSDELMHPHRFTVKFSDVAKDLDVTEEVSAELSQEPTLETPSAPEAVPESPPAPASPRLTGGGKGTIRFVVKPWGTVNCGPISDTTPFADKLLPAGEYECVFSNPDYPWQRRTVRVEPNETVKVQVNFVQ